jgi:hypothetical protein
MHLHFISWKIAKALGFDALIDNKKNVHQAYELTKIPTT